MSPTAISNFADHSDWRIISSISCQIGAITDEIRLRSAYKTASCVPVFRIATFDLEIINIWSATESRNSLPVKNVQNLVLSTPNKTEDIRKACRFFA